MVILEADAGVDAQQDAHLLNEILRSRTFERTASLRKLLAYLWEQHGRDINEYAIAIDALGRSEDFDSKIDATVRVQIGRLRRLLDKFYADEGSHNTRRVTVPMGSHQLAFLEVERAGAGDSLYLPEPASANLVALEFSQPLSPATVRPLVAAPVGYGLLALAILFAVILLTSIFRAPAVSSGARKEAPLFWKTFLNNGKSTRIVLPAPTFFSWETPSGHSLMVRDITVNDPLKWTESPALATVLGKEFGAPKVWQGYTVASDTFASLQLARFLDSYGIHTNFSSSADSPNGIVDHENIVTFGTQSSLATYQSDLDRLTFRMATHEIKVTDLLTLREFNLVHESGSRDVAPGIVAVIPRGKDGSRLMLIQGAQTMALISYLTSEEGMREIGGALADMKTPYFEAVILSEVNRGTPLQSRLCAIRAFEERSNIGTKTAQPQQNTK